jgi:hypothetical protein
MKTDLLLGSAASVIAALFLLAGFASIATAAAPQLKTSAPGYYRMMLGDFEVTALSDGTVDLAMSDLLTNVTAARLRSALAKEHLKVRSRRRSTPI